ncbi:MAG: TonB-dependent receptor [Undibacterium sp.]|uniref:TonB-dependent receptor n=1 Tax=Undibacterium sp. TaxID=1914977 RepID=UPI00272602D8|nr:TonB-dependent receptor [Undibacterium sp.]MDO8654759.1 TonB-dependent receptor [Undibacterium sp.]
MQQPIIKYRVTKMTMAVLGALSINTMAQAQTLATPAQDGANSDTTGLMQEVVVTGTSERKQKFKTPYAVSTIGEEAIQRKAPKSAVDLLKAVPGIQVENSGGEGGGENVVIRGLPFSGFRLLDVLEDGIPLFESNYERQLQIDELYRVDLGTTRAEIVRGGTAPIFSNNASGGVVNFLSNHGTQTADHAIRFTAGTANKTRVDVAMSGPVNDKLLYSVSGFYRRDNGLRNPGFNGADNGGQIKVGGTYLLDNNRGKLWADVKLLNDRSIFYAAFPLVNPNNPSTSLASLIDPGKGTLDSNSFRNVTLRTLDGAGGGTTVRRDLADGIHADVKTVSFGGDFNLNDGWKLSDKARYTTGQVGFDALFNGSADSASANLSSRLAAARGAFPLTTSLRYLIAGTNTVFDPAQTANLTMTNTWSSTRIDFTDLFNDVRLSKAFDGGSSGKHEATAGLSLSKFKFAQQTLSNTILTNVKSNPNALDIQALDASGNPVGMVTENGFLSYGPGSLIGNMTGMATGIYVAEDWHITKDLQVDAGARRVYRDEKGNRGVIASQTLQTTGNLAARSVTGLTGYVPYENNLSGTSWTLGSSYQIAAPLNTFTRYSSTFSLPRLSDQWGNINNGIAGTLPNGLPIPIAKIKQGEVGMKMSLPTVQMALIGFWSHFDSLSSSTFVTNAQGNLTNQPMLIDTTTKGIEFEGTWRPSRSFELSGSITLQDPKVVAANPFNLVSASSIIGKKVPRTPDYMITLEPAYLFKYNQHSGRLYATYNAIGKRFQDLVNTSVLRPYSTLDLGLQLDLNESVSLQVVVANVTNSTGLTEGNARAPISNALTVGDATVGRPIFGRSVSASATFHW